MVSSDKLLEYKECQGKRRHIHFRIFQQYSNHASINNDILQPQVALLKLHF